MSESRPQSAPLLDHIGIGAVDMGAAKAFYSTVLAPLGAGVLMDFGEAVGFGPEGGPPTFWIGTATAPTAWEAHVAFCATDRAAVDAFHAAAIGAGAEELHAPALHPEYHEHYYGAFVRDPDGNNIEAVCHRPE